MHTHQFALFSSSIILLAFAFFLCIPDLPSNLESLETLQTSSVLISWNWQCWEKKQTNSSCPYAFRAFYHLSEHPERSTEWSERSLKPAATLAIWDITFHCGRKADTAWSPCMSRQWVEIWNFRTMWKKINNLALTPFISFYWLSEFRPSNVLAGTRRLPWKANSCVWMLKTTRYVVTSLCEVTVWFPVWSAEDSAWRLDSQFLMLWMTANTVWCNWTAFVYIQ